jgi:hypothetical protein
LLWALVVLFIVVPIAAFIFRDLIGFVVFRASVKPPSAFVEAIPPVAPDYANLKHWAALPHRRDGADYTPSGISDGQASASADVFFVHPTTYFNRAGWNAPVGEIASSTFVDKFVMKGQASAFNGAARVYAPRYRQAQIYAFFALDDGGNAALELAYSDVEAAFDHYMAKYNDGRPFIVAGHSQGALLTRWLLERKIAGTELRRQMVAAYPIGFFMSGDELAESMPDIPVCGTASQTGCFVTWNATGDGYRSFEPTEGMVCVNPLTWTNDGAQGDFEDNYGALSTVFNKVTPGAADARCENGKLYVSDIRTHAFDKPPINMGKGNHHLLDYALYWSNIRENASERVAAFESNIASE